MLSSSSKLTIVLGFPAGVALAAACALNSWIVDWVIGLGWYLSPVVSSMLFLGSGIANRAADHILRYPNKSGRWPTLTFSILRMLDPVLVGWILRPTILSTTTGGEGALLVGMVAVGAMRHAFWVQCINRNEWNWELTIIVAVINNWIDFTHAKCLLKRLAESEGNDDGIGSLAWIGVVLFVIGGVLETHSERQRRRFKDDPSSKGRLYTEGLFTHARHINYFGYILWRTGLGFVSGPPYTLSYGVYHAIDFYIRAIPLLQNHMQSKYGDQW
eukprot:CAMPEP_0194281996 /NCGR_PEP_ID=MMETSP0169-20130528/22124_1 /TAXON_ID=218684 /ORGANISM="Corethron pennatum, Strain L29A3" /LENGTH=271 /DNA_ID=CAMNT_0039027201 /DNA_START=84 /DNA_END=896 /DNA_ORIENTATION=-